MAQKLPNSDREFANPASSAISFDFASVLAFSASSFKLADKIVSYLETELLEN
jgi:hypothetical protein